MPMPIDPEFERWLRSVCFQAPTPEAYDLARSAWDEAQKPERERCRRLMDRCLNEAWDRFAAEINPK